ncbi:MAG: adenylyl-sulfate kinase [Clostridia bacterium]|jgi:dTMP kinase|nr:adenylyl-sulfate kinase [Clostridia bacterium]
MKKINMKPNKFGGKLIVFEGVDGSGKTTLTGIAKQYLEDKNIKCYCTKMPSDRIRKIDLFQNLDYSTDITKRNLVSLFNMTIFSTGDRLLTLDSEITPALKRGEYVLCDRYCYTSYIRCKNNLIYKICQKFIKPDCVIIASAKAEELKIRVKQRIAEKDLFYDDESVIEQIKRYKSLAKKSNFKIINTQDEQSKINERLYSILNDII